MAYLIPLLLFFSSLSATSPEPIQSIRLEESTRGTQRSIEVDAEKTTVRMNDAETVTKTDGKVWKKLREQIQELPLKNLDQVPVVSKKHQVDGALAATLTIATSGATYTSPTFDHNAPPAEFEAIVDCLYRQVSGSMRENFQR